MRKQCGRSVVIEHNGDVYACDHCVYPEYKLGNILSDTLPDMVAKSLRSGFGVAKEISAPALVQGVRGAAGLPGRMSQSIAFETTYYDEPGLQYLCAGYKKFFLHIRKYLRAMATLLENGLPASRVMEAIKGPLVIKREE